MRRLQAQLHELSLFNHGFARDGEELFDNPVDARLGEWRILEHPASAPCQQIVGQVRQQDQCFLSSQALLAPAVELEAALHKKSGQKSDAQVNKDFLVSFWRFFETRQTYFARKNTAKERLFVQSRWR